MVKTQKNLVVVQTLSKSFGLAGLRLGYFIANKQFTEAFNKVLQYPYPLSTITIESGILALKKSKHMKDSVQVIKQERKRIIENLRKYNTFEVYDSEANFVLFDAHGSYQRVYTALLEQGIPNTDSFSAAFEQAKSLVEQRERDEDKKPSKPQIQTTENIENKLREWRKALGLNSGKPESPRA